MYPRQDNSPRSADGKPLYNGTNPWMAGSVLMAAIDFREADREWSRVDDGLMRDMILQTMNYVVKYGYETSRKYQSYDYFIYSEAARDYSGGGNHLLYPLAYALREYQRGVPNPQWYDTVDTWKKNKGRWRKKFI
jgi:hypothetical protein